MPDYLPCGTCRHWLRLPADPNSLGDVKGECREGPPQMRPIVTQHGVGVMIGYPTLPPGYPGCARHKAIPEEDRK